MGYLLVISFLLHLITLFIIIVLMQKVNTMKPSSNAGEQEKVKREIEDLLVAYTAEMKEENEKLVNKISQMRKTQEKVQLSTIRSYEKTQTKNEEKETSFNPRIRSQQNRPEIDENEETYAPPLIMESEDIMEQSSTAQILSLSKQGYSPKEIAKKLNIGDGEVELLLKFHK